MPKTYRRKQKRQFGMLGALTAAGVASYLGGYKSLSGFDGLAGGAKSLDSHLKKEAAKHVNKLIKKVVTKTPTALKKKLKFGDSMTKTKRRRNNGRRGALVTQKGNWTGFQPNRYNHNSRYRSYGYNGSILKTELGAAISDSQCVYIGHATNFTFVISGVFRAIINMVFTKQDQPIFKWEDFPLSAYIINIFYRDEGNLGVTSVFPYTMNILKSYLDNANDMSVNWNTAFGTGLPLTIISIETMLATTHLALVPGDLLQLHISSDSRLTVQNITYAGPDADPLALVPAVPQRELKDNILCNPLKGKLYSTDGPGNHWRNGFLCKRIRSHATGTDQTVPAASFIANANTAIIQSAAGSQLNAQFYKPPEDWAFEDRVRSRKVGLEPGAITADKLNFNATMSLTAFFEAYAYQVNESVAGVIPFGFARMYAFEKRCDSRTGTAPVAIHYELNQVVSVKLTQKRAKASLPYLNVAV